MMTVLLKFIVALSLYTNLEFTAVQVNNIEYVPLSFVKRNVADSITTKSFQILDNKCNVCHAKRNRRRLFTLENMNSWADDVYKQVFVKKRMPKGKKIKLTSEEYQNLLNWITSTKK
ncbi:hypothetical protein D1816_06820 [Aquimarina sp. AD10]|nr:hypothetical protein D1816_06820 [Aquimarina sp. AD10]RKM96218.1 hypothetical protein D7033_16010 [Aquimarina sp. AD10]